MNICSTKIQVGDNFGEKFREMLGQLFELLAFGTLVLLVASRNVPGSNLCTSKRCIQTAMMFLKNMDRGMLPCHNFRDFICGNFPKWNPLMPGRGKQSAFTIREQYVDEKLLQLLKSPHDNLPIVQKVRTIYHNCMNEETIEQLGSTTVPLELNAIGLPVKPPFNPGHNERYDISRLLARLHKQATYAKFLFDATIRADRDDVRWNRLYFDYAPALNQFWTDEWTNDLEVFGQEPPMAFKQEQIKKEKAREIMKSIMKKVVQHMNDLAYVRFSKKTEKLIDNQIQEVVDFLEKLQETKNEENLQNEPTKITVNELQKKTDEILGNESQIRINWLDYLETLFENVRDDTRQIFQEDEPIIITNIQQFEAALRIVAAVSQNVFVSAMWWIVTDSVSPFASKELQRIYNDFDIQLQRTQLPRQKQCLNVVKNQFSYLLGVILVSAHGNATEDREKVIEMLVNIKSAFEDTITNSEWLDVSTKMAAVNKLQYIKQLVSFEKWMLMPSQIDLLYADRIVIPGQYFTTIRLLKRTFRDKTLSFLSFDNGAILANGRMLPGKPGEVNASYSADLNGIDIPIGILGPPFYGLGLEALNYGAIGVIMAHELAHGFDNYGRNYNSWGRKKKWWKKSTNTEYDKRADCFVKTYDNIFIPAAGRMVNGKLTLDENISDYLGFTQALKAYRMYVQKHGEEKRLPYFEHYSHEKLFTMAFANMYCDVTTPAYAKWQLESDEHSPGQARVLGVLRNSVDFAKIWKCSTGCPMNPKEKCNLW